MLNYAISSPKDPFVPGLVEIGPVLQEKKIIKFSHCIFFYFVIILGKELDPSFEHTWIPFTQEWFVPSLVEIDPVVLDKKIFKLHYWLFAISSIHFLYFGIISPWIRVGPFIWTNLNFLYQRMICAKLGQNMPICSGEENENVNSLKTFTRSQLLFLRSNLFDVTFFGSLKIDVGMMLCRKA